MKLPNQVFGIKTEEAYQRYLEESKKPQPDKPQLTRVQGLDRFSLEDLIEFWRVNGVNYRNDVYQVDLAKELLDNKASKTQDEWASYSNQAITNGQFYVGDFPLYHALFTALFKNKDNSQSKKEIEKVKKFISKKMFDYWLLTLTRIKYGESGQDTVIHNLGTQDRYIIQGNIVGQEGYITKINPTNELNAILGRSDINEINQVYNWLTGKNAYLWRVNSKPSKDDERVAWFSAGSDRADLCCIRDPTVSGGALGVRAKKIIK